MVVEWAEWRQIDETLDASTRDLRAGAVTIGIEMTFRVMGPHERGRFAPEAWGHLLSLANAGALSAADLEQVIDRALMQFDGRVSLDDVRSLLDGGLELPVASADHPSVH